MTRVDIRRALDMLPRFDTFDAKGRYLRNGWSLKGKQVMCNYMTANKQLLKVMDGIVDQTDAWGYKWPVRMVDVSGVVCGIHASLLVKHLMYLCRKDFAWQNWPRSRLPVYISYLGKLFIWNGTHRLTLCRLANRKVRARILVVEDFIKWKKAHPERKPSPAMLKKVEAAAKAYRAKKKLKNKGKVAAP